MTNNNNELANKDPNNWIMIFSDETVTLMLGLVVGYFN